MIYLGERRGLDITLLAELSSNSSSEDETSVQKKVAGKKRKVVAMATDSVTCGVQSDLTQDPAAAINNNNNKLSSSTKQRRTDSKTGKKKLKSELFSEK